MPSFSFLSKKFFGNAASTAAGFAAGVAVAPALEPVVQSVANEAWTLHPDKPADAMTMALGVAQGQVATADAYAWAAENGYGKKVMDALVNVANGGPGVAAAFTLWRRGTILEPAFRRALKREGLEQEWIDDLVALKTELVPVADLARMIHRGLIPDPGLLKGELPSGVGNVEAYPVYQIDALEMALGQGWTHDMLGAMVGLQGNPMGAHEAAQAFFRGILNNNDYLRAISEGNTRNEWANAIREQSRQILTSHEYIEARLRGWLTSDAEMYAGTFKHGMSQEDTDLMFKVSGRPLSFHQVWIGLQRGGVYDGPTDEIDPAFLSALRQSNIRPEYYNLAWAQRYNYPAPFVLKNLTSGGAITEAEAEQVLKFEGYEPTFAAKVAASWASSGTTTSTKKALTPSQIRSAVTSGQFPRAEGLTRLEALGYTAADAAVILDNPTRTPPAP